MTLTQMTLTCDLLFDTMFGRNPGSAYAFAARLQSFRGFKRSPPPLRPCAVEGRTMASAG